MLGKEPTIVIQTIVAAVSAVQLLAITMPNWAHTVLLVTVTVLGAILNRATVSPAP